MIAPRAAAALAALVGGLAAPAAVSAGCGPLPGDVNEDGALSVVDVQCAIVTALWSIGGEAGLLPGCVQGDPLNADLDCNGGVNVVDVQLAVSFVLGLPLAASIDTNGSGCPDSCEPPLGADCCDPSGASCGDPSCVAAVCSDLKGCCDGWGLACSLLAGERCEACATGECGDGVCDLTESCAACEEDCGACPVCGDGECGFDEDCETCSDDCGVCPDCGDGVCVDGESCVSCPEDCGPCAGPCCEGHDDVGCEVAACQGCVCALDDFCCEAVWDFECAAAAASGVCPDCPECEPCPDCDGGPCCEAHGQSGCEEGPCEACVCGLDPYCCHTAWDGLCASVAALQCAGACPCGDAGAGACCEPSFEAGCSDPDCEDCVCDEDLFCCLIFWDQDCVAIAGGACGGTCGCAPVAASCAQTLNCLVFCNMDDAGCQDACFEAASESAGAEAESLWQCLQDESCLGDPDPAVFEACLSGPCAAEAATCFSF